jgi:hypothetical protein
MLGDNYVPGTVLGAKNYRRKKNVFMELSLRKKQKSIS